MYNFFVYLMAVFSFSTAFAQTTKKVFFVGNSYMGVNNLPNLIQNVANSTQDILTYQAHTPGGSTLQQHANNQTVINTINQGDWDYVVLQQQSQMPAFPINHVENNTYNYAAQLSDAIKSANTCGTVMFFMTWGYKNGDATNCVSIPYICTYEGMDDMIYERYMQMTIDNDAVVSPVGRVWRAIRTAYPDYELFQSDNSHPSLMGSMAAAYAFYTVIFKKDPNLITYDGDLNPTQAQNIKQIVKTVVYDQLLNWKVGENDITTHFDYVMDNNIVSFTNKNTTASTFIWDFGDGNTSTQENPTHTYDNTGAYEVSLTSNACDETSTKTQSIEVAILSKADFTIEQLRLYPNPSADFVYLMAAEDSSIRIFDNAGKELKTRISLTEDKYQLDIRELSAGIYFVQIQKDNREKTFKIVKK
jgi:hypothetical protein